MKNQLLHNQEKQLKINRFIFFSLVALCLVALFFPEIAMAEGAENPLKKGTDTFLNWINGSTVAIGTIIIILAALGAYRTLWGWDKFWWAVIIVFIIFYAPTLVTTLKSLATGSTAGS